MNPRVGLTVLTSSFMIRFTIVVLPALSSPLALQLQPGKKIQPYWLHVLTASISSSLYPSGVLSLESITFQWLANMAYSRNDPKSFQACLSYEATLADGSQTHMKAVRESWCNTSEKRGPDQEKGLSEWIKIRPNLRRRHDGYCRALSPSFSGAGPLQLHALHYSEWFYLFHCITCSSCYIYHYFLFDQNNFVHDHFNHFVRENLNHPLIKYHLS